jgi:hypothetical protein
MWGDENLPESDLINWTNCLEIGIIVDFQFGIIKVKQKYAADLPPYHLILLDAHAKRRLPLEQKPPKNERMKRSGGQMTFKQNWICITPNLGTCNSLARKYLKLNPCFPPTRHGRMNFFPSFYL